MNAEKTHENLLRRKAERQGLRLIKSRRRDPQAPDYGTYWLADATTNAALLGGRWGARLDEVEKWLEGNRP